MESAKGLRKFLSQKMVTLLVLAIIVYATFYILTGGAFLKKTNISTILNLLSITGLLSVAVGCLIISGHIDLSTGAIGTMGGMVMALILKSGVVWPIAVALGLLTGVIIGLINAVLVNALCFQPFIATMAIASVMNGLTYIICGGQSTPIRDSFIKALGTGKLFGLVPTTTCVTLAIFIIFGLMLSKSKFGRSIYLIGGNRHAARLSGINPVKTSYILFMNSGLLSALAGILLDARLLSGSTVGTSGSQFSGITAAMLGGISFGGGSGSFAGAFIGLLIMVGFSNGLSVLGVIAFWQTFASGALLIFALALDYIYGKRMNRRVATGA